MTVRQQDGGERRRIALRILADDVETPVLDRAAGGFGQPVVTREHVVETFLVQHRDAFVETEQHQCSRRVGEIAGLVHVQHVVPREERLRQLRGLAGVQRLRAERVERHAGRQHQTLLRAADGNVHAPFVMAIVGRGERGNGIDQQQRRMTGCVDRLAHAGDVGECAGRGFVVQHADGLDLFVLVGAQALLDFVWIDAVPPVSLDDLRLETELLRHLLPEQAELSGLDRQHFVARRQRVGQRCFPRAGAGRGEDDHRMVGLEDGLDAFERLLRHLGEFGTAMVDHRLVDRAQDAIRHRRRAGNMQRMAPNGARRVFHHGIPLLKRRCVEAP